MLTVLEDECDIREAERHLVDAFAFYTRQDIPATIGYPGGSERAVVSWFMGLNIWTYLGKEKAGRGDSHSRRYWNAFGTGRPNKDSRISPVCEINSPASGIYRRVGGAFARDTAGALFLLHRGLLKGGGMTKDFLGANYRGTWTDVMDGGKRSRVVLVGAIGSPDFAERARDFVFEIARLVRSHLASRSPE